MRRALAVAAALLVAGFAAVLVLLAVAMNTGDTAAVPPAPAPTAVVFTGPLPSYSPAP